MAQSLGYKGYVDGQMLLILTAEEQAELHFWIDCSWNQRTPSTWLESGAKELSEEIVLEALLKGHEAVRELIAQEEIIAAG